MMAHDCETSSPHSPAMRRTTGRRAKLLPGVVADIRVMGRDGLGESRATNSPLAGSCADTRSPTRFAIVAESSSVTCFVVAVRLPRRLETFVFPTHRLSRKFRGPLMLGEMRLTSSVPPTPDAESSAHHQVHVGLHPGRQYTRICRPGLCWERGVTIGQKRSSAAWAVTRIEIDHVGRYAGNKASQRGDVLRGAGGLAKGNRTGWRGALENCDWASSRHPHQHRSRQSSHVVECLRPRALMPRSTIAAYLDRRDGHTSEEEHLLGSQQRKNLLLLRLPSLSGSHRPCIPVRAMSRSPASRGSRVGAISTRALNRFRELDAVEGMGILLRVGSAPATSTVGREMDGWSIQYQTFDYLPPSGNDAHEANALRVYELLLDQTLEVRGEAGSEEDPPAR